MEQDVSINNCRICGSLMKQVRDNDTGDELLKQCLKCDWVDGEDLTYSKLLEKIEKGITEHFNQDKCPKCGNFDVNKFTYQMRNDAIVLDCQCGSILDLDANMEKVFNIKENATTNEHTLPNGSGLPKTPTLFECECGNTDPGFATTRTIYFDNQETKYIKCEACTRERYFSCKTVEKKPTRPFTLKNGAKHKKVLDVPRRKVKDINMLEHGDHVAWSRWGYWHHGIIELVDAFAGLLLVIEYDGPTGRVKDKGIVKANRIEFSIAQFYKYIYPDGVYYSPLETIQRARSKLKEDTYNEPPYNLFTNNCEHFARWAKTGVHISFQVEEAKQIGMYEAKAFACNMGKWGYGMMRNPNVIRQLEKPTLGLTAGAVGINLAAEAVYFMSDIQGYRRDWTIGKIDDDELTNLIIERSCEGAGSAAGRTCGAIVGLWLCPYFGGIGGVIGSTVGSFLGRIFGRLAGKGINALRHRDKKTPNQYLKKCEQIKEN